MGRLVIWVFFRIKFWFVIKVLWIRNISLLLYRVVEVECFFIKIENWVIDMW